MTDFEDMGDETTRIDIPEPEDWYTTRQAMLVLRRSERRVQQMCEREDLECEKDERGAWRVSQRSVHEYLAEHGPGTPRISREERESRESTARVRLLENEIRQLEREIGRLEARLQMSEERATELEQELRKLKGEGGDDG